LEKSEKYLFDARGYIILKNIFDLNQIEQMSKEIIKIERAPANMLPKGVSFGKTPSDEESYLSSVICASSVFDQATFHPKILDIMSEVTLGLFRLNHSYSISRFGLGGYTYMHMGGTPIHPKGAYMSSGKEIFSLTTKAVIPLTNHDLEDGCFAAIPGSHKAIFERPFGNHPDQNEGLEPISAKPGDVIIFTEALAHGSLVKKTNNVRRTLYLCYSVAYMPDWTKLDLKTPEWYIDQFDGAKRKVLSLKVD
jgi:ectoine hydroxylase-related dioxygenase (phytanoyl-CoA dioxygenase family)